MPRDHYRYIVDDNYDRDRHLKDDPYAGGPTPKILYIIVGIPILLLVIVGILLQFGIFPGDNAALRFKVRAPASVPEWLISTSGSVPLRNVNNALYAYQTWCTVPEARSLSVETVRTRVTETREINRVDLICVQYWQAPHTLQIEPDRKTQVTVDGTQGWLWRLTKDDFWNESRIIKDGSGDPALLRPALAETFESPGDAFKRAAIYFKVRDERLLNTATLSGPALMLQWNKGGQHFVLIGENQRPVTEDLLLDMANSMVSADQIRSTGTPEH